MPSSVERIAQQLEVLRARVDRGLRTPQLIYSSIDNGSLPVKDSTGQTTVIIGQQGDGTAGAITVAGPYPPIPVAPTAQETPGGIIVSWNGEFEDPQPGWASPVVAPMTFNGVLVEVSDSPSFAGSPNRGVIASAAGGDRSVNWPMGGVTLYARLRTRDLNGKVSDPSVSVTISSGQVQLGDLGFNIADIAGNTIYYTADGSSPTAPPDGFKVGDLWLKKIGTSVGGGGQPPAGTPLYETYRWLGATWALLQNQGVSQALADALAAQTTANSATTLANAAQASADAAITAYYQTTAPASGMQSGDLWVDTDDGNKLYRYTGSAWSAIQDAAISTALTNAGTAQATADRKIRIFAQVSAPTAEDVGDLWIDVDDGNKMYVWGPTTTIKRTNFFTNPSFEYDASGTLASGAPTNWAQSNGGTTGTRTASIDLLGSVGGTKRAKIVGATLNTLNTAWIGFSQEVPCVPGDILAIQTWLTYAVVSANQRPEYMVEWLNSSGTVLSTLTDTTATAMGTAGSRSPYSYTTTAAPASTARARITIRRRGTLTTGGANVTNADLAVDAAIVEINRAAGAPTTYFDGSTSTSDFLWNGQQYLSTSSGWFQGTGSNAWQPNTLRTSAFEPKSILAANVIATGSITAALLEANMILTTVIIAGNPAGDYATMTPTGFRVFAADPVDLVSNEVIRMGTDTNDYFAVVDSSGATVAAIDDTGQINSANLNVKGDPVFMGRTFTDWIGSASNIGADNNTTLSGKSSAGILQPVTGTFNAETGIIEVPVTVSVDRWYMLRMEFSYSRNVDAAEVRARIRDGGTGTPTLSSPVLMYRQFSQSPAGWSTQAESSGVYLPTTGGTRRLLLTLESFNGNSTLDSVNAWCAVTCMDMGPRGNVNLVQTNTGGGGTPVPPQQYAVDLAPAGWASYRGDGTTRTDVPNEIVQGWDPSGFNGDGGGIVWFTLPSITGTVDLVKAYTYTTHWYYNSGGSAIWNLIPASTGSDFMTRKLKTDTVIGGYPKPGGKEVVFPSTWYSQFKTTPPSGSRAIGMSLGRSGGTNLSYYGRFYAPDTRLRIWYTQ